MTDTALRHVPAAPGSGAAVTAGLLAPALVVVLGLFGGGLVLAVLQSLGVAPVTAEGHLTLVHYRDVLTDPEFLGSLLDSLWISATSTVLAVALGGTAALLLYRSGAIRAGLTLLQTSLPVPHLVGAATFGLLLSDSGLVSRLGHAAGLLPTPAAFPPMVADPYSIGIITTYTWKEAPFVAVVALASLGPHIHDYEQLARTLAAGRLALLRHVTLPLLAPALFAAGMLVFAFSFGAYEVPALLGRSYPEALPVLSYRRFSAVELAARPEGLAVAVLIALVGALVAVGYAVAARALATRSTW